MGSFNTPHPFRGFLYWYCTCQFGGVAFYFGLAGVLTLLNYHYGAFPPDWFTALWYFLEESGNAICAIFGIITCIAIASAHGLGFWKGFGGFWLGNLISTVCAIPVLIATGVAEKTTDPITVQLLYGGITIAYGALAGFMARWRGFNKATTAEIASRFD